MQPKMNFNLSPVPLRISDNQSSALIITDFSPKALQDGRAAKQVAFVTKDERANEKSMVQNTYSSEEEDLFLIEPSSVARSKLESDTLLNINKSIQKNENASIVLLEHPG